MTGSRFTVAVAQLAPRIGEPEHNRALAAAAIERAAADGAKLVVLPELANSGYVFADAAEARGLAEPLDGRTMRSWRELSGRLGVVIVGGLCERLASGAAAPLGNAAVVIDGGELAAVYRKTHLWDRESDVFEPGSIGPPVVATSLGPVGVCVCYDAFFPEVMRSLALAGAELIAVPANIPVLSPVLEPLAAEVVNVIASAVASRVYVAQCDRTGAERGVDWVGASAIVDPDGRLLASPARGEALLVAEVDIARARDKRVGDRNDVLADRRPELYGGG
jgi:predicted amidohydrolase